MPRAKSEPVRWLLLIHQLPAKPAYLRVKLWRRLQGLGAVALKNAVNALPVNDQTREDFAWLVGEITANGGEALLVEAQLAGGLNDAQVRELFNAARDADYNALADELRPLLTAQENAATDQAVTRAQRLRKRFDEVTNIDFFAADGREPAEGLLVALEAQLKKRLTPRPLRPPIRRWRRKKPLLGNPPRRARRPYRQRLADPQIYRPAGEFQIRHRQ